MASPNSSFTDIITTTLQGYSGEMADNITNHNALLKQINKKGNKQVATGRSIVQELEYAENSTVMWYSGSETLDISPAETFTAAEYNYKQLAGNATITGLEQIQNSGKEAVHNLLKSRIRNLEKSLKNTLATALYADGTGTSSKEIGGLQLLVADVNTNTVGGISGTTYAWWKNYVYDFSTNSVTASATTIQHAMNLAWINTVRGSDKPDIIPSDSVYYLYYLESLTPNQRFMDDKGAGVGFTNLVYQGNVPVVYDDQCPASHMYFLNTDYIFLRPAKGREFIPLGEKSSVNQDAMVMPVVWAGNMTVSNRSLQAVVCA
ncbi:MAG: phage major capsid protein [Arenimonas sp.]|jgi:hypothetical protein